MGIGRRRFGALLVSSSVGALLIGACAPAAFAQCAITINGGTVAAVTNGTGINCITIKNGANVTGNVTNTAAGTIAATGAHAPSGMGISVNNGMIGGAIINAGTITAGSDGIFVSAVSSFAASISNSGTIAAASGEGVAVYLVSTFAGHISNSGTIGSGFEGIVVNFVSTFAGGIGNSGTIAAGSNGIIADLVSTFAGGINNSGKITAVSNGIHVALVSTFAGGVTSSGTLSVGSQGIFVQAVSTFLGGINNSGKITAASDGIRVIAVSTFAGDISNSGTIAAGIYGIFVTPSTFTGNISNSGMIVAASANGIFVFRVSTFTGGIGNSGTISAAYGIDVTDVSTFAGSIANSGRITAASADGIGVAGVSTFAGGITNSGRIVGTTGIFVNDVSTFTGAIVNSGTITGTGGTAINLAGGPAGMTIDILGGAISGDIVGKGTTSGDTVNFALGSGSFAYANTIAAVQSVNIVSGTLFDSGAISAAGVTVESGGTLAPGLPNTTGALNITGNLAFAGGGFEIQLTSSAHASATVSGNLSISNGTVALSPLGLGAHYSATTFSILTYGGTLAGTFNPTVTYTGVLQLSATPTISYVTNNVDLSYGNSYADLATPAGANANQQNVINGINNAILAGDTVPAGFQQLAGLSIPAYLNALTRLDGEDATGAQTGAFTLMNEFRELMLGDSTGGAGAGGNGGLGFAPDQQTALPPDIALAYDSILKAPPKQTFDNRWSVWGSGFGGSSLFEGNAAVGSNNVTTTTYGSAAGMEYRPDPNTRLGFALAGAGLNWGLAQGLGSGRSDALQAGVYGKTYFGPAYISGALAFGNDWFTTNRTALGDQLTATFTGQSYAIRGEAGYRYAVPLQYAVIGITPYAALQTQWFRTPAYSETDLTGGGFGLSYNANTANDTRSELGARFDNLTAWNNKPLVLRASLAWAHDWTSGTGLNAAFEALPGSAFTVNGAAVPRDSALTTASAQYYFTPDLSFTAKFAGEFAPTAQTYAGSATLRYTW